MTKNVGFFFLKVRGGGDKAGPSRSSEEKYILPVFRERGREASTVKDRGGKKARGLKVISVWIRRGKNGPRIQSGGDGTSSSSKRNVAYKLPRNQRSARQERFGGKVGEREQHVSPVESGPALALKKGRERPASARRERKGER